MTFHAPRTSGGLGLAHGRANLKCADLDAVGLPQQVCELAKQPYSALGIPFVEEAHLPRLPTAASGSGPEALINQACHACSAMVASLASGSSPCRFVFRV